MKALRTLTASLALAAGLTGMAAVPDDRIVDPPYPIGPRCYGRNYTYPLWNSINPQVVYGVDSCRVTRLLAARAMVSNFAQFAPLLGVLYPKQVWPAQLLIVVFNAQTGVLQSCAAPGRGIEMIVEAENGGLAGCVSQ